MCRCHSICGYRIFMLLFTFPHYSDSQTRAAAENPIMIRIEEKALGNPTANCTTSTVGLAVEKLVLLTSPVFPASWVVGGFGPWVVGGFGPWVVGGFGPWVMGGF